MAIVEVRNLEKAFDGIKAVDDISFTIEKGEIFGFLGPNGAGKTTTINMLTGLARPSSGSISVAGYDGRKEIKRIQQIIGVVPDESNLYDEMDGFDNLCFCASLYGLRKADREERAAALLERFNLKSAGNRIFKKYSKGMKRKLTIAAGIIHRPQILFLDEPTTGIDVESARQIRTMISRLKENGTTVFLTTHYIEEAERLCDRIAFLVNGKIVQIGVLDTLMQQSKKEYTVKVTYETQGDSVIESLRIAFPMLRVEKSENNGCLLHSSESFPLSPILRHFDESGIAVYEAKILRPTLEEVFVRITGIEANLLRKD